MPFRGLLLCCLLLSAPIQAQPLIRLPTADTLLRPWSRAGLLEDPTRKLSLRAVMAQPLAFSSTAGRSTQLGFSGSDFWLRFRVRTDDTTRARTWLVHNPHLFANRLTMFVVNETSGAVVTQQWGQGLPASAYSVLFYEGVFRLSLQPGRAYTVLMRQSGNDSKVLTPIIWETHAFYEFVQRSTWIHGLYLGTLLFTMVFQLIFFAVTGRRNFILYLLYLIGFFFVQIQVGNGMPGAVYLWPESVWLKQNGLLIAAPACISFGMFFFANGLNLHTHSRWLFRLLQLDGAVALLLTVWVLVRASDSTYVIQHALIIALTSSVLVVLACIVSLVKGYKPALYYLLATLSFMAGVMTAFLWHLGLVPVNVFTNYSIDIGSVFEVIFFTLGLADDYRRTHRQERLAQQRVIDTLRDQNQQISAALLQGQALERQRVAIDLHDNLGSTLASLSFALSALNTSRLSPPEQNLYTAISQQLRQAYGDLRLLAHNLLPDELAKHGLPTALTGLVAKLNRNTALRIVLTLPPDPAPLRTDARTEFELYSVCLELVNNALKHAKATEIHIGLGRQSQHHHLILTVADNGVGLPADLPATGQGLQNVRARVEGLGGIWRTGTGDNGCGLLNTVTVPLR